MKQQSSSVIVCPFSVCVDRREQAPYSFLNIKSDAANGQAPLIVRTATETLESGDYSISGYEHRIAVERKSLEDAYSTFSHGRARFERELARLQLLDFAAVVIEAGWGRILGSPPAHSRLLPKSVFRSIIAWQQRFPGVHWLTCPDRRFAEIATFRILERFWRDRLDPKLAGKTAPATTSESQRIGATDAVAAR